ncbi:MAG: hypothetical protein ACRCXC_08615 [Legionella sp.]
MTRDDKKTQRTDLGKNELNALFLLDKAISTHVVLEEDERRQAITFLEQAINDVDMKLNKQLLALGHRGQQGPGVSFDLITLLGNLTVKSRDWHEVQFDVQNATLSQYKALSDLASLTKDLAVLEQAGLLNHSQPLTKLYQDAQMAKERVDVLDWHFARELQSAATTVFAIQPTKGAPMLPHPERQDKETALLYSEEYRLKLEPLIKPVAANVLKERLGDTWLHQLETRFGVIQRQIHDATLLGPTHSRLMEQDSSSRARFQAEENSPGTLICSPFVGACTRAAINKLNTQLIEELGLQAVATPLIQLPTDDKVDELSPSDFINAMDKCQALERRAGQATSTMRGLLSDAKEGDENHQEYRPK